MSLKRKVSSMVSVMTPFPYTIDEGANLSEAKTLMAEHSFRHLPVTSAGKLVGILSDRDLKVALAVASRGSDTTVEENLQVKDACESIPFIVDVHDHLDFVARTMAQRHIGSALVTKDGKLVGIFTSTDACRLLSQTFGPEPSNPPDELA